MSSSSSYCASEDEIVVVRKPVRRKERVSTKKRQARQSSPIEDAPSISQRVRNSPSQQVQQQMFQNDMTGRKPIRPSALRYSLKLVEREAERSAKAAAERLMENGEEEESRKVLVNSSQHASKIVERVRQTLRQANMPARYVRIVDVSLDSIDATNKKRRDDIVSIKNQLARLKKKKAVFETEFQAAKAKCDELGARLGKKRGTPGLSGLEMHPLLTELANKKGSSNKNEAPAAAPLVVETRSLTVKRPEDESKIFSALLENVASVYD